MTHPQTTAPEFRREWALFLDVDGTLVDFVKHPELARAGPDLIEILERLYAASDGALALVSGRSVASVDRVFEPLRLPVAGLHGHERRGTNGRTSRAPTDDGALTRARDRFQHFVEIHPGTFVEEKGAAIALHFRRAPEVTEEIETLAGELDAELAEPFCIQRGKMVLEVRSCQHTKATALEAFMSDPGFANRVPVFLGDDETDEDGFEWVNERGGLSVKVGPGPTAARFRFPNVGFVVQWLEDYARFLQRSDGRQRHGA